MWSTAPLKELHFPRRCAVRNIVGLVLMRMQNLHQCMLILGEKRTLMLAIAMHLSSPPRYMMLGIALHSSSRFRNGDILARDSKVAQLSPGGQIDLPPSSPVPQDLLQGIDLLCHCRQALLRLLLRFPRTRKVCSQDLHFKLQLLPRGGLLSQGLKFLRHSLNLRHHFLDLRLQW